MVCGSGDLAKSLGYADKRHPDIQAMVAGLMRQIADAGKIPGRLVTFGNVQECIRGGARLLYTHTDVLIERAVRELQKLVSEAS